MNKCIDYLKDSIEHSIRLPRPNEEHELFGAYIIKKITDNKLEKSTKGGSSSNNFLKLCLRIALKIFLIQKTEGTSTSNSFDEHEVYKCLSSIVSSEIDADRIDYTLRDARSSGLNVGNFDFSRLLNNTVLALIEEEETKQRFRILVTDKALSSIEQFFNYRYLLYEYIYYHHNVAKYDGLLAEIIRRTLQKAIIDKNKNVFDTLQRYEFITKSKDGQCDLFNLERVEIYDDSWLRAMLLELWRNEEDDNTYKIILETFLFRKKEHVSSLVKRTSDYDQFIRALCDEIHKDKDLIDKIITDSKDGETLEDTVRRLLATPKVNMSIESIIKNNEKENYAIIYKQIKPKLASSEAEMFLTNEQKNQKKYSIRVCNDFSPYLKSLLNISQTSMNFYFGCVYLSSSPKITLVDFKKEVINILIKAIKEALKTKK